MRKLSVLILSLLACHVVYAQHDMRLQLQLGNFGDASNKSVPSPSTSIINNYGVSLQHSVYKDFSLKINYTRWGYLIKTATDYEVVSYYDLPLNKYSENKISDRRNFSFIDIAPVYQYFSKRHEVFGSLGISYAWGTDYIMKNVFSLPGYDVLFDVEPTKASYVGTVWELGYNYHFSRINIGLSLSGRHYPKQFNTYNTQLNIGYNFNFLNKNNKKPLE